MQESYYDIHGVRLRVATGGPGMAAMADSLLRHFRRPADAGPALLEILCRAVSHRSEIPVSPSPAAEMLFDRNGKTMGDLLREEWRCTLYRDQERFAADFHEQGLVLWEGRRGRMETYLVQPEAMHPDIARSFFHFGLAELLRARGLYTIHATALEQRGRAVLIPGSSGRGKTTCCISLLRAGYRCLSDDHPLLRENGAGLEILTFPEKIDVTEHSIEFFPELKAAKERLPQGVQKRSFVPEEIYPHAMTESGKPALLLFPLVVDAPESRLEPLPKNRALEEIMRQGLLVLDREVAGRQFMTLSRLAEQTPCYRLYFGEDVLDLPRLIDPLLAAAEPDGQLAAV
jgi:hypothetical protein